VKEIIARMMLAKIQPVEHTGEGGRKRRDDQKKWPCGKAAGPAKAAAAC